MSEKNTTAEVTVVAGVKNPVAVIAGWGSGRKFFLQHAWDYLFFDVHPDTGVVNFNAPASANQDYNEDDVYECTVQVEYGNHIEYKQVRVENDRRKPLVSYPSGFSESFGLLPIKPVRPPIPRHVSVWTH